MERFYLFTTAYAGRDKVHVQIMLQNAKFLILSSLNPVVNGTCPSNPFLPSFGRDWFRLIMPWRRQNDTECTAINAAFIQFRLPHAGAKVLSKDPSHVPGNPAEVKRLPPPVPAAPSARLLAPNGIPSSGGKQWFAFALWPLAVGGRPNPVRRR